MRDQLEQWGERGNVYALDCPTRGVLDHVTSRWGVLVLVVLAGGSRRFSELARCVGGVSDKMLAQTLKTLQSDGFVARASFLEVPVRVEYSLTPLGRELAERLAMLTDWIETNIGEIQQARADAAAS